MSANSALVNTHISRVIDDGGDFTTINQTWLQAYYAFLVSKSSDKSLLNAADPMFGVQKTGSNILRVHDLGTTWLPRSLDLTPRDSSKTTYSATGLNGTPCFVNADGSSQLYWGRNNRYNHIRWKQQITIAVLYERTQTSSNICLFGNPTSSTVGTFISNPTNFNNDMTPKFNGSIIPGISLIHTSGSPGTIQFSLADKTGSLTTASVAGSGATVQVAVGTYDGVTMKAYSDGTGGTGVTSLFPDPLFAGDQALAGCRKGGSIQNPVMCMGDTLALATYPSPNTPPYNTGAQVMTSPFKAFALATMAFTNAFAQFKGGHITVLGVGYNSTNVSDLTTLLKTTRA